MKRGSVVGGFLAGSLSLLLMAGCASGELTSERPSRPGTSAAPVEGAEWRWVGVRNVEVLAPKAWAFDYEAVRPDCIDPRNPRDFWARDVPEAPYVTVGTPNRGVPAIGCLRERKPSDPGPAFGDLPFSLWQPFVKVEQARPDLEDPAVADGTWQYRGWRLTRETIDGVQVTALAPPDRPSLGTEVLSSARQVEMMTSLGCAVTSPVQAARFARPTGPPIPPPGIVKAVAICHYSRMDSGRGLDGSRRIIGQAARELVKAIQDAPRSGGPNEPEHCAKDMYGDSAIALRFFASPEEATPPLAEAYVYYDWCFGNGIFDSQTARRLTKANCSPLFAKPPVSFWSGQMVIADACGPLAR